MLGGDRQRLAKSERKRLVHAWLCGAALAFVGGEDHRLAGGAHQFGEDLVAGDDARPRIDEKHHEVRLVDGSLSLLAHAGGETRIAMLEPRGVDQP